MKFISHTSSLQISKWQKRNRILRDESVLTSQCWWRWVWRSWCRPRSAASAISGSRTQSRKESIQRWRWWSANNPHSWKRPHFWERNSISYWHWYWYFFIVFEIKFFSTMYYSVACGKYWTFLLVKPDFPSLSYTLMSSFFFDHFLNLSENWAIWEAGQTIAKWTEWGEQSDWRIRKLSTNYTNYFSGHTWFSVQKRVMPMSAIDKFNRK